MSKTAENTINPVIFDEVLTGVKGGQLRMVIDMSRLQLDTGKYRDHLMYARSIPFDLTHLNPADPIFGEIHNKMKWLNTPEKVAAAIRQYYDELSQTANKEAVMLALTTKNEFENEPVPYEPEAPDDLPGFVSLTPPERDLSDPIERRLKQLFDMLENDMTILIGFQNAFEIATVELSKVLNGLQTDAAFRRVKTSRPVREKAVGDGVQS